MSKFYIDNGEIKNTQECAMPTELAFGMGDMIHETVRLLNAQALFLKQHIQNICDTMDVLAIPYPQNFTLTEIAKQITRLLNVNKVYKGGECKIIVYRNAPVFGNITTEVSYALFIKTLTHNTFEFNNKGLRVALLPSVIIQKPLLYSTYSAHMLVQHKTQHLFQKTGVDILAYFNEHGHVFHTSSGDIFYITNNTVYCPSIETNTFRHPLSDFLLQHLSKINIQYDEQNNCTTDAILQADEVFIVNPLHGIQWVVSCNEKTYISKLSRKIYQLLLREIVV